MGTPLARIHLANASADPPAPGAVGPELVAPSTVAVLGSVVVAAPAAALNAEVVTPPTVALELPELSPHPATSAPLASAATVSRRARLR